MVRILEMNYWRVTRGAEQDLEAVYRFGCVHAGEYVAHVAFLFLWDSIRDCRKCMNASERRFECQRKDSYRLNDTKKS